MPATSNPPKNVTIKPAGMQINTALGVPTVVVTSAYTAAAAMAESPVAAAAYIDAEATMRALSSPHLMILAADKEGRHGLLDQLGLAPLPPDIVSVLAGGEIQRRADAKQESGFLRR
jgi:hypothetical protein